MKFIFQQSYFRKIPALDGLLLNHLLPSASIHLVGIIADSPGCITTISQQLLVSSAIYTGGQYLEMVQHLLQVISKPSTHVVPPHLPIALHHSKPMAEILLAEFPGSIFATSTYLLRPKVLNLNSSLNHLLQIPKYPRYSTVSRVAMSRANPTPSDTHPRSEQFRVPEVARQLAPATSTRSSYTTAARQTSTQSIRRGLGRLDR